MKPYSILTILILLLGVWTQSFAQSPFHTSKPLTIVPDSQTCYNKSEMQAIASTLVYGVKLEKQHVTDSTRIDILKKDIIDYKEKDVYYKNAIKIYDFSIAEQKRITDKTINKLTRNIKWLKVGWISTTVFLAGTTMYFLVK